MAKAKRNSPKKSETPKENCVDDLIKEIVEQAKKLARYETTSCFRLIESANKLIRLEESSK